MGKDVYNSLDELKSEKVEGVDYKETIMDRNSGVTVMSIHGGFVEHGTSELAGEIAKNDFNYYSFEALTKKKRCSFHITSHKFYQEDLEGMLEDSDTAVSVHGCIIKDFSKPVVCIGGLNKKLKKLVKESLEDAGFKIDFNHFPGIYHKNVVNRARNQGVQLELTYSLRKTLFEDVDKKSRKPTERFYHFTNAVRSAIEKYLKGE